MRARGKDGYDVSKVEEKFAGHAMGSQSMTMVNGFTTNTV
jgi:hypothetical protein